MSTKPYAIALLGFTPIERSTFDSFFRLAARRDPGYQLVDDPAEAALIIGNADDTEVMRSLRAMDMPPKVVLIGAWDHETGWPVHPRPVKLMNVLNNVDQLLAPRAQPAPSRKFADTRPLPPGERGTIAPPPPPDDDDNILVADDSDTVLQFMQTRMRRFGFRAELVRSGEEALERIAQRSFKFIFLDVIMDGMDGYETCKAIKRRTYPPGKEPIVVMLSSRAGKIDKLKGSMAGCDAYLAKPLEESELIAVLARHHVQIQRGFQATNIGASDFGGQG